jgi:tetratricopeptide (TPR) repeat protein
MPVDPRPYKLVVPIDSFDLNLLPVGERDASSPDYGLAIQKYFTAEFAGLGLNTRIVVGPEFIEIEWASDQELDLLEKAISFLRSGDYDRGIRLLRTLRDLSPDDPNVLFNLGMALSDKQELDEAIKLLRRLVEKDPSHGNANVSLGVALARKGSLRDAVEQLRRACEIDPSNPYAHRNLGGLLKQTGLYEEAIKHLRKATELAPDDPAGWFGLGQALVETNAASDADNAFRKVLAIAPNSPVGEAAKKMLSKLAESTFRERGVVGERPDAVMYCLGALQRFGKMSDKQVMPIMFEIAVAGQRGFDINNPDRRYKFNSIEGDFSGLQAVCYMYVAMQRLMPGQDAGIDLSKEFKQAQSLYKG